MEDVIFVPIGYFLAEKRVKSKLNFSWLPLFEQVAQIKIKHFGILNHE